MINIYFSDYYVIVADLNTITNKSASLLYLREDRIKNSLNSFFEVAKILEKEILASLDDKKLGIADIRCLLIINIKPGICLLYTSPSPRDRQKSRMPSSA